MKTILSVVKVCLAAKPANSTQASPASGEDQSLLDSAPTLVGTLSALVPPRSSKCGQGVLYSAPMLTEYLRLAMAKAHYELLGDGEGFSGEIPGFQGVLAQGDTLEGCRNELASTLEDWLLFRISPHLPIPVLEGLDLAVREAGDPS